MNAEKKQRIVVLQVKSLDAPKGSLRGFASVRINGQSSVTINDLRIIQQDGQKAWVSLPQKSWTDQSGKAKYAPIVEIDGPLMDEISETVLAEWGRS